MLPMSLTRLMAMSLTLLAPEPGLRVAEGGRAPHGWRVADPVPGRTMLPPRAPAMFATFAIFARFANFTALRTRACHGL